MIDAKQFNEAFEEFLAEQAQQGGFVLDALCVVAFMAPEDIAENRPTFCIGIPNDSHGYRLRGLLEIAHDYLVAEPMYEEPEEAE